MAVAKTMVGNLAVDGVGRLFKVVRRHVTNALGRNPLGHGFADFFNQGRFFTRQIGGVAA